MCELGNPQLNQVGFIACAAEGYQVGRFDSIEAESEFLRGQVERGVLPLSRLAIAALTCHSPALFALALDRTEAQTRLLVSCQAFHQNLADGDRNKSGTTPLAALLSALHEIDAPWCARGACALANQAFSLRFRGNDGRLDNPSLEWLAEAVDPGGEPPLARIRALLEGWDGKEEYLDSQGRYLSEEDRVLRDAGNLLFQPGKGERIHRLATSTRSLVRLCSLPYADDLEIEVDLCLGVSARLLPSLLGYPAIPHYSRWLQGPRHRVWSRAGPPHGDLYELEQEFNNHVIDFWSKKILATYTCEMSASLGDDGTWTNHSYSGVRVVKISPCGAFVLLDPGGKNEKRIPLRDLEESL